MGIVERGWWELKITTPLNDIDREHIAKLITEGFTSGEILHEEDDVKEIESDEDE